MSTTAPPLDALFHALAHPARRAVLTRLAQGPAAVSELAEPFDMALPSFIEHLRVLETCALVESVKRGRVRTYRLTPAPLRAAEGWLERQRAVWERRLDQLDEFLMDTDEPE